MRETCGCCSASCHKFLGDSDTMCLRIKFIDPLELAAKPELKFGRGRGVGIAANDSDINKGADGLPLVASKAVLASYTISKRQPGGCWIVENDVSLESSSCGEPTALRIISKPIYDQSMLKSTANVNLMRLEANRRWSHETTNQWRGSQLSGPSQQSNKRVSGSAIDAAKLACHRGLAEELTLGKTVCSHRVQLYDRLAPNGIDASQHTNDTATQSKCCGGSDTPMLGQNLDFSCIKRRQSGGSKSASLARGGGSLEASSLDVCNLSANYRAWLLNSADSGDVDWPFELGNDSRQQQQQQQQKQQPPTESSNLEQQPSFGGNQATDRKRPPSGKLAKLRGEILYIMMEKHPIVATKTTSTTAITMTTTSGKPATATTTLQTLSEATQQSATISIGDPSSATSPGQDTGQDGLGALEPTAATAAKLVEQIDKSADIDVTTGRVSGDRLKGLDTTASSLQVPRRTIRFADGADVDYNNVSTFNTSWPTKADQSGLINFATSANSRCLAIVVIDKLARQVEFKPSLGQPVLLETSNDVLLYKLETLVVNINESQQLAGFDTIDNCLDLVKQKLLLVSKQQCFAELQEARTKTKQQNGSHFVPLPNREQEFRGDLLRVQVNLHFVSLFTKSCKQLYVKYRLLGVYDRNNWTLKRLNRRLNKHQIQQADQPGPSKQQLNQNFQAPDAALNWLESVLKQQTITSNRKANETTLLGTSVWTTGDSLKEVGSHELAAGGTQDTCQDTGGQGQASSTPLVLLELDDGCSITSLPNERGQFNLNCLSDELLLSLARRSTPAVPPTRSAANLAVADGRGSGGCYSDAQRRHSQQASEFARDEARDNFATDGVVDLSTSNGTRSSSSEPSALGAAANTSRPPAIDSTDGQIKVDSGSNDNDLKDGVKRLANSSTEQLDNTGSDLGSTGYQDQWWPARQTEPAMVSGNARVTAPAASQLSSNQRKEEAPAPPSLVLVLEFYSSDFYGDKLLGWTQTSAPLVVAGDQSSNLVAMNRHGPGLSTMTTVLVAPKRPRAGRCGTELAILVPKFASIRDKLRYELLGHPPSSWIEQRNRLTTSVSFLLLLLILLLCYCVLAG